MRQVLFGHAGSARGGLVNIEIRTVKIHASADVTRLIAIQYAFTDLSLFFIQAGIGSGSGSLIG